MCEPDASRIWRYKPNFVQVHHSAEFEAVISTNAWGLRDDEVEPSADALRILAIGDSFTFGWGVEQRDRYTEALEEILRDRLKRPVRVLNAGHWNYSFDQQFLVMKRVLHRFRPALVVQGLYAGHVMSLRDHAWVESNGGELQAVVPSGFEGELRVLADGSLVRTNRLIDDPPFSSHLVSQVAKRFYRWRQVNREVSGTISLIDARDHSLDEEWRRAEECIRQMGRHLSKRRIEYLAFSVPMAIQVSRQEWKDSSPEATGRTIDVNLPMRRFESFVVGSGGRWLDLLPSFQDKDESDLYFKRDPHWTPKGHRHVAKVLAAAIVETAGVQADAERGIGRMPKGKEGRH